MATVAVEQQRLAQFRPNTNQARQQKKPGRRPRGQFVQSQQRSNRLSRPTRTPETVAASPKVRPVDSEQMYNQSKSPEARARLEARHKETQNRRRNEARINSRDYKMPAELNAYIDGVTDPARDHVQGMYEDELDSKGMDKLLDQQYGKTPLRMAKQVLAREKARIKKAAVDAVKKQAKKALKEAFKEGMMKGGKQVLTKTFWSGFAQGSAVEMEGALLESWFGTGTVTGSYQSLISVLHGGKKLLGEKGVISFIEPDPFKLPSQGMKDPKTIASTGGTNILIGIYDLFGLIILTPLYIILLVAIFILVNLLIILILLPIVLPAHGVYYFINFAKDFL